MPIMTDEELEAYFANVTNDKGIYEFGDSDFAELAQALNSPLSVTSAIDKDQIRALFESRRTGNPEFRKYPPCRTSTTKPRNAQYLEKIYLYFFDIEKDGKFVAKISSSKFDKNRKLRVQVEHLINEQISNGRDRPTSDIDDFQWDGPCYLAFFMNNPDWDFIENRGKNYSLHFFEFDPPGGPKYHRNKSFFEARSMNVSVRRAPGQHKVLIVENHHIRPNGKIRRKCDEPDHYKFDIYYRVPFAPPLFIDGKEYKLTIIVDPGGQNTGPPD